MGCPFLLQGIFLTQGSNLCLLHYWQILYSLSQDSQVCIYICVCVCIYIYIYKHYPSIKKERKEKKMRAQRVCVGEWDSQKGHWREGIPALTQRGGRGLSPQSSRLSGKEARGCLLLGTRFDHPEDPLLLCPKPGFPRCREGGQKAQEDSPASRRSITSSAG